MARFLQGGGGNDGDLVVQQPGGVVVDAQVAAEL